MSPESTVTKGLEITSIHNFEELESRLRNSPTKGVKDGIHHTYRESSITLKSVNPNDLFPCALYVLSENLIRVQNLRYDFKKEGIDITDLDYINTLIEYDWQGSSGAIISPPIVEKSNDDESKLVIVDGLHRVLDARLNGINKITVALIENSASPLPAYPVEWDEVKVCDEVPRLEDKRKFRFDNSSLSEWVSENYQRFMSGFDFPERTQLPNIKRDELNYSGDSDLSKLAGSDSAFVPTSSGILLVRRKEDKLWALPSGHIDTIDIHPNSLWSKQDAPTMRRELYEETNLIALRWKKIASQETVSNKRITFWLVNVTDNEYVPMDIGTYIAKFNQMGGNGEISELGLFQPKDLQRLDLFKPEYNIPAILFNVIYSGLPLNELSDKDLESIGLEVSTWKSQVGVEHLPIQERYKKDFSQLRTF